MTGHVIAICRFTPPKGEETLEEALTHAMSGSEQDVFRPLSACKTGRDILRIAEQRSSKMQAMRDASCQASLCTESFDAFTSLEVFTRMASQPASDFSGDLKAALDSLGRHCDKFVFAVPQPYENETVLETVQSFNKMAMEIIGAVTANLLVPLKAVFNQMGGENVVIDLKSEDWSLSAKADFQVLLTMTNEDHGICKMCKEIAADGKVDRKLTTMLSHARTFLTLAPSSG